MKSSFLNKNFKSGPNVELGIERLGCLSSKGSGFILRYASVSFSISDAILQMSFDLIY